MKVIYSDAVVADAQSFSPSARKPREVVNSWLRRFPVIEIVGPEAVSVEQICLAHAPHYVRGIFSFKRANGLATICRKWRPVCRGPAVRCSRRRAWP